MLYYFVAIIHLHCLVVLSMQYSLRYSFALPKLAVKRWIHFTSMLRNFLATVWFDTKTATCGKTGCGKKRSLYLNKHELPARTNWQHQHVLTDALMF